MNLQKINPRFQELETDYLYHFGIDSRSTNMRAMFGDVQYVILNRFNEDASVLTHEFAKQWYGIEENNFDFKPLFKTERYHLYKTGPVLNISHGIGAQSMLIALNELVKLLFHADVYDATFLKIGPAGGIGLDVGSMMIATEVVNHHFKPIMNTIACGEEYTYPTHCDSRFVADFLAFAQLHDMLLESGKIMSASDYHDGQGRLSGFLPLPYSAEERDDYLKRAEIAGIKAIDMEALYFSGFCHQLEIPAGIIALIAVDRQVCDDIPINKEKQLDIQQRAARLVSRYIMNKVAI